MECRRFVGQSFCCFIFKPRFLNDMSAIALPSPSLAKHDSLAPLAASSRAALDHDASSTSTLRVLHLFNRYRHFGGEEAAVLRMTDAMRTSGANVEECFFSSEGWEKPGAPPRWKQALLGFSNPHSLASVRDAHQAHRSNLWLAHNLLPVLSPAVLREARRQRVPMALYLHNYRPFSVSGGLWADDSLALGGLRKNFLREIIAGEWQNSIPRSAWMAAVLLTAHARGWYRHVDAWIAVSDFVRQRFIEAGVPAEKVHVLAYPFTPSATTPEPRPGKHFLFLGRLTVAKGIRVLLRAWEITRAQSDAKGFKLIICGEGELQNEVIAAAAASNGTIEYHGNVTGSAKQQLIADSIAVIVPSIWWDPYPTVIYEAFSAARPVLGARSGGIPESVLDGECGLLHEPGNAEALAHHIQQLHHNSHQSLTLGQTARRWLLANSGAEFWWHGFERITNTIRETSSQQ